MIKNKTKFTNKEVMALNNYAMFNALKIMIPLSIIIIVSGIIVAIGEPTDIVSYFLIAFGVIFTPLFVLIQTLTAKKIASSSKIVSDNTDNVYVFEDDEFSTTTIVDSEVMSTNTHLKYNMILKVRETKEYFFLFIDKYQAFVLSKTGFECVTAEEFYKFILAKMANSQNR